MTPMSCDDVRAVAAELVLGTLDGGERAAVIDHMSGCPRCREEVAALADTVSDLALLAPPIEPSAGFAERVLAAGGVGVGQPVEASNVVDMTSRVAPRRSQRRGWAALVLAAAAVIALVFGLTSRQTDSTGAAQLSAMVAPDGGVLGSVSDAADGAVAVTVSYPSNWPDYTIEAVNADGTTTALGPMVWRDGAWRWQGVVPEPSSVDRLRVVRPDGQVTCWGRLPEL